MSYYGIPRHTWLHATMRVPLNHADEMGPPGFEPGTNGL